ncbi:AAA family ATPase [Gammaproteobacteria bacterium]|nr:AAA family ATPase [Gammaproteobacteria bacterium]
MSRFNPHHNAIPVFEAAEHWRAVALDKDGSVFTDGDLWNLQVLEEVKKVFVDNPEEGDGSYLEKLEGQFQDASAAAKQLAAEMHWLMMLAPSKGKIFPSHKKMLVTTIWSWSGEELPSDSEWLTDEVLEGLGNTGVSFNINRWREFQYFILMMIEFKKLPDVERTALLADGWAMAEWLGELPEGDARQMRHILLHMLYPDSFDRIFGKADRRRLIRVFRNKTKAEIRHMTAFEMSQEIQQIRREQEKALGTTELDFYWPPLQEMWNEEPVVAIEDELTPFQQRTEGVTRQHVLQALAEIDEKGWPEDARSSTYDLIEGAHRYPPKYVVSLATKLATGQEFERSFFSGGKDSQAFKLLEKLGFYIERKDFLSELVSKFLAQADDKSSLVVSDYPKEYRGLGVKVSFGMGAFAHIPWVSFTGYEQTTSHGIYPVLLYYKQLGVLIVAYGISETNSPKQQWQGMLEEPTIKAFLKDAYGENPKRYGASYVHTALDLSEGVDESAIGAAIDDVVGRYHSQFATTGVVSTEPVDGSRADKDLSPYTLEEALKGLFIEESKFAEILDLLKLKKNLILQGPPGVGKTFVCKRLAYALLEKKAKDQVTMVQFHQSYAYEDFIQGYRPSGEGFHLKNGIFYEFCERAKNEPGKEFVFIIDEINRGNLSKVFGELMLLIEADKRGPDWAIPLTYTEDPDKTFYIPENLYLIGLMNTADRSLAMVDYALRRRFGFTDLVPGFDTDEFREYMQDAGAESAFTEGLISRMEALNAKISADKTNLGHGYCIGHSFFCVPPMSGVPDWGWYKRVIQTEIAPLVREYYFDDEKQANVLVEALLREG